MGERSKYTTRGSRGNNENGLDPGTSPIALCLNRPFDNLPRKENSIAFYLLHNQWIDPMNEYSAQRAMYIKCANKPTGFTIHIYNTHMNEWPG